MSRESLPLVLSPDAAGIARAARLLGEGRLVAVPTETVYGLAARADSDAAVAGIYRAKGRPSFNPLIVHVGDIEQAERLAVLDTASRRVAERFWPGPLTLVLPRRGESGLADAVTAGLPTVALRCPAHPVMRRLLTESGLPIAAPSANRSGGVSPTSAAHVVASLGGRIDAVLDAGPCKQGLESTIVALRADGEWQVLRPGPVAPADIEALLGRPASDAAGGAIEAPGQLSSHYAPGKPVRLDARQAAPDEYHIGFGQVDGDENLSGEGDMARAAARLYAALHRAAESDKPRVAVAPIPREGIGIAINDRRSRAAADQ